MAEVVQVVLLVIASCLATVVASWIRVSYTLVLLLLGLGLGLADALPHITPSADVILLLFLPPLLFEAAFVLDLGVMWSVRRGVVILAGPGVLVAMLVGGAVVRLGVGLPWDLALLFGAMVAATDPVAVLATFRQLGVGQRLTALLEGESLLNDGVALVLFGSLVEAVVGDFTLASALGDFLLSVAGGSVLGAALGWLAYRLVAHIDDHLTEMTLSVALAYGAFLAADALHLSGVLATIAAASLFGHLARGRGWIFATGSAEAMEELWTFLAFVANAALFLLVGLEVGAADLLDHPVAVAWGIVAALAGRAAVAYAGGALLARLGAPVRARERHTLFWGGLRGAVALAAALSLGPDIPHRDQLLAMTYGAVLFTLLVQGLTIGALVRRLGLVLTGEREVVVEPD